jgi:streptomycin 6-kinase
MKNGVEQLQRQWSLSKLQEFKRTPTSTLYTCERDRKKLILKVFTSSGVKDESFGSSFFKLNQECCAHLYHACERAQLLEFLPGPDLYFFSKTGHEEKATEVFINLISRFKREPFQGEAPRLSELCDGLTRAGPPSHLREDFKQAILLWQGIERDKKEEVLLHGDLHHENIVRARNGDFLVIDPKGIVAEPHYELTTVLKNPWAHPSVSHCAHLFEQRLSKMCLDLGLERRKVLSYCFIHLCLSISWSLEDGGNSTHQEAVLGLVKKHL